MNWFQYLHDEFIVEAPLQDAEIAKKLVENVMKNTVALYSSVNFEVDEGWKFGWEGLLADGTSLFASVDFGHLD